MIKYLFQWFYCKSEMGGNISRHYGPFQFSCRRETIEFSRSNIVAGICYENLFCLWIYRQIDLSVPSVIKRLVTIRLFFVLYIP